MQESGVFVFLDGCLDLIQSLFNEHAVLNVYDAICVALDLRVVRHHDACGSSVLTFALGTESVDV